MYGFRINLLFINEDAPQLTQQMKLVYEDEFQRALQEDGSASSTFITPKAYHPGT